jgi:hypothetical protein
MPRLAAEQDLGDDLVLTTTDTTRLLQQPVVVEEKLDGTNVSLWAREGIVASTLRSGSTGMDRGNQLGALRAWTSEHSDQLLQVLRDETMLYAEWLFWAHSITYDSLPSYLIGIDLWHPDRGFASVDRRNEQLAVAGVPTPPELFRGVVRDLATLGRLLERSRVGSEPMEGVVVRSLGQAPRIAKLLRGSFERLVDEEWRRGRPRNLLASRDA